MDVGRNPFLFDDPGQTEEAPGMVNNPFLSGGGFEAATNDFTAINPFSDNVDEASINFFDTPEQYPTDMNPFGDPPVTSASNIFGSDAETESQPPLDIFGTSTVSMPQPFHTDNFVRNTADHPPKPPPPRPPSPARDLMSEAPPLFTDQHVSPGRPPPPRPPPPSKETKELLQTVIGTMDAATDTLQGKLITTRTPCPSPGSGVQSSRSPTPDIQITGPDKEPDAFSTVFGKTIELSEEELDENQELDKKPEQSIPSSISDVDLFGDTVVQAKPKTNQDILSLFNKPKEGDVSQIDLLSGDIMPEGEASAEEVFRMTEPNKVITSDNTSPFMVSDSPESIPTEKKPTLPSDIFGPTPDVSGTKDPGDYEAAGSPELISEKSDSEPPTVIEAGRSNDRRKSSTLFAEDDAGPKGVESGVASMGDVPMEIFGSIEPSPSMFPSDIGEQETEVSNTNEYFVSTASESVVDPMGSEIFGVPSKTEADYEESTQKELPSQDVSELNTYVSPDFPVVDHSSPVVDFGPFGLFGDIPVPNESPVKLVEQPVYVPDKSPSSGFDIFGDQPAPPTYPTGSESTGAALFETETPAPNVGMSLFGGGEEASLDIFAESHSNTMVNPFAAPPQHSTEAHATQAFPENSAIEEEFDAFSARFDNVTTSNLETGEASDPFSSGQRAASPWGNGAAPAEDVKKDAFGFDDNAQFDPFLSLNEPPPLPKSTPRRAAKQTSEDSDEGHMNIVIRPAGLDGAHQLSSTSPVPVLAPPPTATSSAFSDSVPRFNPFDKGVEEASRAIPPAALPLDGALMERTDSTETPPTPLFEEDQSVPLEPFPRTSYDGRVWEMFLRQPNKKKITGQRFWKKVYVKMTSEGALQLYNNNDDKEPFQELPLQPCYSVSDIGAQQFDQFGKIFTVKIQYIFYKERPGVRPGQISKAERITTKLSKFAQYAIAGDYEGVKEFASDVRKLGMPVEHAPQISQLLKLGTQTYEDLKVFASLIEENMFALNSARDRALSYKMEEVQLTAVDEIYVEQDLNGAVTQMVARVRIYFLGFLSGMPEVDLGINDLRKQGHEVVGRHDIIPVITEEWIRLEDIEFHSTVDKDVFEKTRHIKFKPPDACYIELMRYRVRPPKNRELPLQVKTKFVIQGKRIDIQCEILVPGFSGRKLGQVPCEDVAIRFPLPECWIYLFRVEKHFRYGSVKSAHRRTGKVKGIERLKGAVESAEAALMEVTSGQAKYEHQHRAIVWRMPRLPKEGQGAYSVHQFTCKMVLTSFDQLPEAFDKYAFVEFTMPATTVSHCVMRSVSVTSDDPPEKYVRYLARHEYKTEIEFSTGSGPNQYIAATMKDPTPAANNDQDARKVDTVEEESSSDDSS